MKKANIFMVAAISMTLPLFFYPAAARTRNRSSSATSRSATLGVRAEAPATSSSKKPEKQKLSKEDSFKVEVTVYRYLLQRHFWDNGEYSAVFFCRAMMMKWMRSSRNFRIMSRQSKRVTGRICGRTERLVDKETGKPAMILSVETLYPVDDTVQAVGKWYAGGAVSGFYTFNLKKNGTDWVIESVKEQKCGREEKRVPSLDLAD